MNQNRKLLIITGPTAVGKTEISIQLAKQLNGEIISADSCQVYKYLDIGSAKITQEEMDGVTHHLIDVLDPSEAFDVARFQKMALTCIEDIYSRGHVPIVVGGTGFYIQALLYGIEFGEEEPSSIRKELEHYYESNGTDALFEKLLLCDPKSAQIIHKNNTKRVIRALEYYEVNGSPISEHNEVQQQRDAQFNSLYVVLTNNRDVLYERINTRVDLMVKQGLVEEVKNLLTKGYQPTSNALQAIGYKEIISYLDGIISLDEAVSLIKQHTRNFAKRQLTWFRREKNVFWIDKSKYDNSDALVINRISEQWELQNELL